jgi:PTS system mannose-specific IIC component
MTVSQYTLAALVAGTLALERKAFLQAMLSRPLVAGALVGLATHQPLAGLAIGTAFELFYLGGVNLGAALPDNELFGTVAAAACAGALSSQTRLMPPAVWAAAALLALPAAKLGKVADRLSEQFNGWATSRVEGDRATSVKLRYNLFGLWLPFVSTAAICVAGGLAGELLLPSLLAGGPPALPRALGMAWVAFLLVASAVALRSIRTWRAGFWAGGAAIVAALGQVLWVFS